MITNQTGPQPADFADVRATNLAVVLRYMRMHAPCSRADIASTTGLNKSTVSSLVADLIDRRLVREIGMTEARVGRPATMLVLDGSAYAAIGLEVNADYMTVVAIDLTGERLLSWRRAFSGTSSHPGQAAASISALVKRAVSKVSKDGRHTLGLTIGVPGLVDGEGVVRLAPNLGWQDADLRSAIRKALGDPSYPVDVENDANLAVLAEQRYGGYAETANLIYLTGEVGIGAGIISDGRLLRGQRGYAGEFGHLQVDPAGPKCGCGRHGCLEALAGISSVVSRALATPAPQAAEVELDVDEVVRRAKAGDAKVLKTLAETGRHLGHGISTVANLINPDVVVLGGYFVRLSPWLVPEAVAELRERSIAPDAGGTRIVASNLDLGAAAYGGAARVLDAIDSGKLP
ncbi:ROK family transcriptional regulator [Catelliglobosispora koreensis]|uniref:ROK family transcriptional regulator n=1 Tax=Catelliglobosispora koreensis TaxID=129052 RepID=UPI0003A1C6F3|nr:ROK family transcriptional regulator [Catelliglobosispora koreensis]